MEAFEQGSDPFPDGLDGALPGFSEERFELGEDLFNRVQIGAIGRQKDEPCAGGAYGFADCPVLVRPKIVHDDDVALLEGRDEDLLDIGEEGLTVDGAIQHEWGGDRVVPERGEKRQRLPVAVRDFGEERLAAAAPAARAGHVRFGPGLVDKNKARWINPGLVSFPAEAAPGDVGAVLLGGEQGFF